MTIFLTASHDNCEILTYGNEHKTHVDGTFYQMPRKFPCVLHDRTGCLFITKERYTELVSFSAIRESTGGAVAKINIAGGISKIAGYNVCPQRIRCPKYRARKE